MKDTARLRRAILNRTAGLAVLGQGYAGLTLSCAAAGADFDVVGIDIDADRIDSLRGGVLSVPGVDEDLFTAAVCSEHLRFETDPSVLGIADIIAVCVPTPVRDGSPDLSYVEGACRTVAEFLRPGHLVVLESTTYPGTTDELVRPILESSGLRSGRDFLVAYSPERIDPGNREFDFQSIPRVVGGLSPEGTGLTALFYAQFVDKVEQLSSSRAAELAKLLENAFRHVNIGLVNEMAILCHEMGIDVWEVIHAAGTKPFGFMPFYPGPGVGGHCIPLDPAYLAWQVRRDAGHQFRILEQAQDINAMMPTYVATRIADALNDLGKPVKGAHILILGVTYKPDIGDVRESPALRVMQHLHRRGANLAFHDPYVAEIGLNGRLWPRTELSKRALMVADCVALLTGHRAYDLEWIAGHSRLVFDARNAFGSRRPANVVAL